MRLWGRGQWGLHNCDVLLLCPQEVHILKCQLGDKLQIKLDAEPTVDLSRVLQEMRCHYEALVQTNHNDLEEWFQDQVLTGCCLGAGRDPGFHRAGG